MAEPCGESYTTVRLPITATQYATDEEDGFTWCHMWTDYMPPPMVPTCTAYLRDANDPAVLAGGMTNCTFTFDSSSEQFANMGFFFLIVRNPLPPPSSVPRVVREGACG